MLKIAKSVEYAILGLKYIAENSHDKVVSTAEMSQELDMPYNLLAKIMQKLVKNNIIASVQGTKGGYSLIRNPEDISLYSVISALDQNIEIADCFSSNDCKRNGNCCLENPLSNIQDKIIDLFSNTTLKEIIN
ncbi:RrF2 family transcriptional regulator [Bacteroidota bacterium]